MFTIVSDCNKATTLSFSYWFFSFFNWQYFYKLKINTLHTTVNNTSALSNHYSQIIALLNVNSTNFNKFVNKRKYILTIRHTKDLTLLSAIKVGRRFLMQKWMLMIYLMFHEIFCRYFSYYLLIKKVKVNNLIHLKTRHGWSKRA